MAKLTDEEKATLEALQARANEPDDDSDSDFDVEWWEEGSDGTRRGGRMPWKQGKGVYGKYFPELFGEKPPDGGDGSEGGDGGKQKRRVSEQYFGRNKGSGQD